MIDPEMEYEKIEMVHGNQSQAKQDRFFGEVCKIILYDF